jgi:hypothetical protein
LRRIRELCDEKNKLQKKYNILLEDVHKWMDVTERQVLAHNHEKNMNEKAEMHAKTEDAKYKLMEILKIEFGSDLAS